MRFVIKFGTAVVTNNGFLDEDWIKDKAEEISDMISDGDEVVIVSSGAVAAGLETLNLEDDVSDTLDLQMISGVGQIQLINAFSIIFKKYDIDVSQMLLTHHNFSSEEERNNIHKIINNYLSKGIVPVINENDVVSNEELMKDSDNQFSDNDILASLVAEEVNADMLVLLTDVDGLYDENPKVSDNAEIIEEVENIDSEVKSMASSNTNSLGTGGMKSKIEAAENVTSEGIKVIVGCGDYSIRDLVNGEKIRTLFK